MIAELTFVVVIIALALPGLVVRVFELGSSIQPHRRIAVPRAVQP